MINPKTNNLVRKGLIWPNEGKSRQEIKAGHFTSIVEEQKETNTLSLPVTDLSLFSLPSYCSGTDI